MPDSESSERTEPGSDELLLKVGLESEIMYGVVEDDKLRAIEEKLVSAQPADLDG